MSFVTVALAGDFPEVSVFAFCLKNVYNWSKKQTQKYHLSTCGCWHECNTSNSEYFWFWKYASELAFQSSLLLQINLFLYVLDCIRAHTSICSRIATRTENIMMETEIKWNLFFTKQFSLRFDSEKSGAMNFRIIFAMMNFWQENQIITMIISLIEDV